ncbi:MAG: hypothetical protein AB7C98_01005 [Acidithiobacillus sp.]
MDVYKLKPEDQGYSPLTKEHFEQDTRRQSPWYQKNTAGEEIHFAACPACDNPIQIIGLYRIPKNTVQPYGKHLAHSIKNLATLDTVARDNCPYFKPRPYQKSDRKTSIQGLPLKILHLLITQFDRVMYVMHKQTGIWFSRKKARQMLEQYRSERGYLYSGATLMNVPWMFAYMADSQSLFGQKIGDNRHLVEAIREKVPHAKVASDGRVQAAILPTGKEAFVNINVCFIHHRTHKVGDDAGIIEMMTMVVSTEIHGEIVDVYKEKVTFDHAYFQQLIDIPDERGRRQPDLLDLAKEILGDLV